MSPLASASPPKTVGYIVMSGMDITQHTPEQTAKHNCVVPLLEARNQRRVRRRRDGMFLSRAANPPVSKRQEEGRGMKVSNVSDGQIN
jgi:hypothetical protein